MYLLMQSLQAFAGDMGVNLSGGEIRMPQHNLNAAQVGAVFKQMGGKRVPQGVR